MVKTIFSSSGSRTEPKYEIGQILYQYDKDAINYFKELYISDIKVLRSHHDSAYGYRYYVVYDISNITIYPNTEESIIYSRESGSWIEKNLSDTTEKITNYINKKLNLEIEELEKLIIKKKKQLS